MKENKKREIMGTYNDGNMMVGVYGEDINFPEDCDDEYEWLEDNGLDRSSLHYGANIDSSFVGYILEDITEDGLDNHILNVKKSFELIKKFTNVTPKLVGVQDIG